MKKHKKILSLIMAVALLVAMLTSTVVTYSSATATIDYSFSGKNSNDGGYAEGTIKLTAPAGTYWLYWADDTKALEGYSELASLTVTSNSATHSMYAQTAIPVNATKLIAIASTTEPTVKTVASATAVYNIPDSKRLGHSESDKLYSFASYSDVHIDATKNTYKYSEDNWANALKVATDRNVDFIVGSGDYVNSENGSESIQKNEWKKYQKILAQSDYCNPIYEAIGNHELWPGATTGTSNFINATGLEGSDNTSTKAYFEKTIEGDHFIFMALEESFYPDRTEEFSTEQLDWLEGLLKKYSGDGKNIYIVEHSLFYKYGAGDNVDGEPYYDIPLSDNQASTRRFKSLLETYKDTIFLSGHTHIAFCEQFNYSDNDDTSAQMVHNSSVGGTRTIKNGTLDRNYDKDRTEGYIVDVYDNGIIFNGANLYYNEYDPNCCYLVRTSQQAYESMSSTEPTSKATTATTTSPSQTDVATSYYLKGSFNSWGTTNPFYETSDSSIISTTLKLSAGTYTFKISKGSSWYGNSGIITDTTTTTSKGGWEMKTSESSNCTLKASGGYYTFNFNTSSNKLTVLYSTTEPETTVENTTVSETETNSVATTESTVATTESKEPTTESTVVTTESKEPTTESTVATTESKEPTTESTVATTESKEPTTESVDITSESSEEKQPTTEKLTTTPVVTETEEETTEATTAPIEYTLGDVDADGRISVKDATYVQKSIIEMVTLSDVQKLAADVNGDDEININDVTKIQKYVAEYISSFTTEKAKSSYSVGASDKTVEEYLNLYYRYSSYDCYQALKKAYRNDADSVTQQKLLEELLSVVDPDNVDSETTEYTVYFENTNSWSNVYAYCWTGSSKNASWPGEKATYVGKNSNGKSIYSYKVNTELYANIVFNNNSTEQTKDIALTDNNLCYYLSSSTTPFTVASYAFSSSMLS